MYQHLKLYATDLTLSTEIEMTSVVGTQDGRIFMCSRQDGCFYELHYQENESWFGKRMQIINHSIGGVQSLFPRFAISNVEGVLFHASTILMNERNTSERVISIVSDMERNCIYAVTLKNNIQIYKPSGDKTVQHVQTLSNLYKAVQDKAPGYPALNPKNFSIAALHVVEHAESRSGIQFFAITTTGMRLYFGSSSLPTYSYPSVSTSNSRPIQLIHVRLPPSNLLRPDPIPDPYRTPVPQTPTQSAPQPFVISNTEFTCYAQGMTIAAQTGDADGADHILCLAPDLTRIGTLGQLNLPQQTPSAPAPQDSYRSAMGNGRPPLTEYATVLAIPGTTWAMATVPRSPPALTSADGPVPAAINELATQFGETPHQFMLLTNMGLTFLAKRRALDYLKAVLEELQAQGNVQPIIEFRDRLASSLSTFSV